MTCTGEVLGPVCRLTGTACLLAALLRVSELERMIPLSTSYVSGSCQEISWKRSPEHVAQS